eukprot:365924-Chlamydomonas_euryale.AAC.4
MQAKSACEHHRQGGRGHTGGAGELGSGSFPSAPLRRRDTRTGFFVCGRAPTRERAAWRHGAPTREAHARRYLELPGRLLSGTCCHACQALAKQASTCCQQGGCHLVWLLGRHRRCRRRRRPKPGPRGEYAGRVEGRRR